MAFVSSTFATSTPAPTGAHSSRSAGRRSGAAGLHTSSTSPNRMSRIQEKDELRSLNDRLANYIQRVQDLESERSSILLQLEEKEETKSQEMGNMRRLYEEELADIRKSLDTMAGENARLQIYRTNLCEENRKLQARNQKLENDLANALARWRKTEAALSSKDAEYSKLLSENQSLNDEVLDLRGQLETVEAALVGTKNQLTSEILRRVELENQGQTLKEQMELQKNISEQEITDLRTRHERHLVEMDSGRQREFESKLGETLQHLRHDNESQLEQYKEEMDRTFISKLQVSQQAVLDKNNLVSAMKEELESATLRMESLSSQVQQYQKDKTMLESRFQELERTLDGEREVWQQKLSQKQQELLNMRSQMSDQLEDYENLLGTKLALDMEINAYRKMLEVEEQRLHLSPSPSQQTAIPRTQEHSSRHLRGKKRKHEEASGSSHTYKMSSQSTGRGAVSVAEVDMDGKYVRLRNNLETELQLGGWMVRSMYPNCGDISFHIPLSCVLAAGQTLTIWAAGSEAEASSGDLILPGHRSWNPLTDVRVVLLNPDHEEVAEHRVCMQKAELESYEGTVAGSDIQHFRRQPKKKKCCSVS